MRLTDLAGYPEAAIGALGAMDDTYPGASPTRNAARRPPADRSLRATLRVESASEHISLGMSQSWGALDDVEAVEDVLLLSERSAQRRSGARAVDFTIYLGAVEVAAPPHFAADF